MIKCKICKRRMNKEHVIYTAQLRKENTTKAEFFNLFIYRCPECKRLSIFELEG